MNNGEKTKSTSVGLTKNIGVYVADEIKRAPIATLSILVGAIGGCLAFFFAGIQPNSQSPILSPALSGAVDSVGAVEIRNILMVMSFFLFSSFLGAGVVRFVAKKHEVASILLSVLIAAVTNFSTLFLVYLAPPRARSYQLFYAAHDNVFYASMVVYLTVCGAAVFKDIYHSIQPDLKDKSSGDDAKEANGIGFLFVAAILIALWGWAVFAGQKRLTDTFLPDIAHYIEKTPVKK
ncbi:MULTISPECIES: hypothetical protein [unclassified Pseudomonas]|nr:MULTISPECIES: hypothetical protein [unclassified Pseudomonas]